MLGDIDVVWVVGECLTKVVNIKYVLNIHKSWTFSGFSEGLDFTSNNTKTSKKWHLNYDHKFWSQFYTYFGTISLKKLYQHDLNIIYCSGKLHKSWQGHKNIPKSPFFFDNTKYVISNKIWRFHQILVTFSGYLNIKQGNVWRT